MKNFMLGMATMGIWVLSVLAVFNVAEAKKVKLFPPDHGAVAQENAYADAAKIKQYPTLRSMKGDIRKGVLVPIPLPTQKKLPPYRRYVRVNAADFMKELNDKFYDETETMLVINSAVRPKDVQKGVLRWNRSAAPATGTRASSHERGTTFDLSKRLRRGQINLLRLWLVSYEAAGRIHVIEERRCFHIMVREDSPDRGVEAPWTRVIPVRIIEQEIPATLLPVVEICTPVEVKSL